MPILGGFLNGFLAALSLVAALFFLRFWRRTDDRFFALFALAFLLLAAQWTAIAFVDPENEIRPLFYGLRAAAFVAILVAIVDKNRHLQG